MECYACILCGNGEFAHFRDRLRYIVQVEEQEAYQTSQGASRDLNK